MNKTEKLEKQVASNYKDAMEAAVVASAYAEENAKLRAFAQEIMESWPAGRLYGCEIQDIALKHSLLIPEARYTPCAESCNCAKYANPNDWGDGVVCYRETALLLGAKLF